MKKSKNNAITSAKNNVYDYERIPYHEILKLLPEVSSDNQKVEEIMDTLYSVMGANKYFERVYKLFDKYHVLPKTSTVDIREAKFLDGTIQNIAIMATLEEPTANKVAPSSSGKYPPLAPIKKDKVRDMSNEYYEEIAEIMTNTGLLKEFDEKRLIINREFLERIGRLLNKPEYTELFSVEVKPVKPNKRDKRKTSKVLKGL